MKKIVVFVVILLFTITFRPQAALANQCTTYFSVISKFISAVASKAKPTKKSITPKKAELTPKAKLYKTIDVYIQQVKDKYNIGTHLPEFISPEIERTKQAHWKGVESLKFFAETLPEYVKAIGHQLLQASPGMVKGDSAGSMVHLRLEMPFKKSNQWDTNIAVSSEALADNKIRLNEKGETDKYLVRKKAKAVLIFLHGGGTKTTGHHVAASFINKFRDMGIDIISLDTPFHGEGARIHPENTLEFFKYLAEIRHKYVPENVPVIVGGHSMGGYYGDMLSRMSSTPEGAFLKEAFTATFNLSPGADHAPGKPYEEKLIVEKKLNHDPRIVSRMAPGDQSLNTELFRDGKASPLSMLEASLRVADLEWGNTEKQSDFLPALTIIGSSDFLYVGKEKLFYKYVAQLENNTFYLIQDRVGYDGELKQTGHLIFDHKIPSPIDTIRHTEERISEKAFHKKIKADLDYFTNAEHINADFDLAHAIQVEIKLSGAKIASKELRTHLRSKYIDNISHIDLLNHQEKTVAEWFFQSVLRRDLYVTMKQMIQYKEANQLFVENFGEGIRTNELGEPETFTVISRFVEKVTGQKIISDKNSTHRASSGLRVKLIEQYFNNLAYREYLEDATVKAKEAKPPLHPLGGRVTELGDFVKKHEKATRQSTSLLARGKISAEEFESASEKALNEIYQNAKYTPPKNPETGEYLTINEAKFEKDHLSSILSGQYIPSDPTLKNFTLANHKKQKAITQKIHDITEQKQINKKQSDELDKLYEIKKADFKHMLMTESSEAVREAIEHLTQTEDFALDLRAQSDEATEAFNIGIKNKQKEGAPTEVNNLPNSLRDLFIDAESASQEYQLAKQALSKIQLEEAKNGRLGVETKTLFIELYGIDGESGLRADLDRLQTRHNHIETETWRLKDEQTDLEHEYIDAITPEYFKTTSYSIKEIFQSDYSEFNKHRGIIETSNNQWHKLWSEKPESESVSLY